MSKDREEKGLATVLEAVSLVEDSGLSKPMIESLLIHDPAQERDIPRINREETVRGMDSLVVRAMGLAIGGKYTVCVDDLAKGTRSWRYVEITGVFFDGYAFIDMGQNNAG